jgi:hypothetical protein
MNDENHENVSHQNQNTRHAHYLHVLNMSWGQKKHHVSSKGTNEHSIADYMQRGLINTQKYNENRTQGISGGGDSLFHFQNVLFNGTGPL